MVLDPSDLVGPIVDKSLALSIPADIKDNSVVASAEDADTEDIYSQYYQSMYSL